LEVGVAKNIVPTLKSFSLEIDSVGVLVTIFKNIMPDFSGIFNKERPFFTTTFSCLKIKKRDNRVGDSRPCIKKAVPESN
jgi:hypothetical protein